MDKPLIVKVPNVPRPESARDLCWTTKPGEANGYCTKPLGHLGKHTWEREEQHPR